MATKKAPEAPEAPLQSEEVRNAILQNSSAGSNTAVGQAKRDEANAEDDKPEIPEGSEIPIAGGEPQPDGPDVDPVPAAGPQLQPAIITTNGTIPINHVASPTGLVPVSAVSTDPTHGARLVQENLDATEKHVLKSGAPRLSRAKIESLSGGELRAVASDRGYDLGEQVGSRSTRRRFLAAQREDEDVPTDDEGGEIEAPVTEGQE